MGGDFKLKGKFVANKKIELLSERELRVLELMAQGHSNKMIAYKVNITEATVKAHVSHIFRKLELFNRVSAVLAYLHHLNPNLKTKAKRVLVTPDD